MILTKELTDLLFEYRESHKNITCCTKGKKYDLRCDTCIKFDDFLYKVLRPEDKVKMEKIIQVSTNIQMYMFNSPSIAQNNN